MRSGQSNMTWSIFYDRLSNKIAKASYGSNRRAVLQAQARLSQESISTGHDEQRKVVPTVLR